MDNSVIIEDIDEIWDEIDLSELQGKSVLITGATGLIGTYLVYSLLKLNQIVDDKVTVRIVTHNGLPDHLAHLAEEKSVEIYQGDLSEFAFCSSLPESDYIIHAAGYGQPRKFVENKIKTIRLNTLATDVLLDKLKPDGKFLFVSTSEIYSNAKDIPTRETTCGLTMPDHPRACYIEGKRCGEAICHAWNAAGKVAKIARVALAYGAGVRPGDGRVLYNFIQKGVAGKINLLDAGRAVRTYCYISDTVSNLWNILLRGKDVTYNVGGTCRATIRELAETVGKILNAPVVVPQIEEGLSGAPQEVVLNIDKTADEFGKTHYKSLDEGIARTVKWYLANIY